MRWYDRQGRPLGTIAPAATYATPRLSPDGRKIAYVRSEASLSDIWMRDLEFNRSFRLTQQSGLYESPVWTPDSARIAFICQPRGVQDICLTAVNGGGEPQLLYESGTWKATGSWMPDGKRLLISSQDPRTDMDIMLLTEGGGEPTPILATPFTELDPIVSPDGRQMAYVSNQSGRPEVYVRSLSSSGQWQIATDGGYAPRWRADGKELFYAAADGQVMAVPFQSGSDFRPGSPSPLFAMPEPPESRNPIFEDVTADGQRFLLNVPTTSRSSIAFHAITNWTSLAPAGGAQARDRHENKGDSIPRHPGRL